MTSADVAGFMERGFVRLDGVFSAEAAREILWRASGCDPTDPATWRSHVVRLGFFSDPPFLEAVSSPVLRDACDALVGRDAWVPRRDLGTFVLRFPTSDEPADTGWHVDASFPGDDPADFMSYRINVASRGRALLMLFLLTDVGPDDAPTLIRVCSHREVARVLAPAGDAGLSFMELAGMLEGTESCPVEAAVGSAGTVYLCHPFVVHRAQAHRGRNPRIIAQPPLHPRGDLSASSPVRQAIDGALR